MCELAFDYENFLLDGSEEAQLEDIHGASPELVPPSPGGELPMLEEIPLRSGQEDTFTLDIQNAIDVGTNSVVEISGKTHVLHIDFESRKASAIPLKPLEQERCDLDLRSLGALLGGSRGPGRPPRSAQPEKSVSLVVLSKFISILVQVPLEDVPPTLKLRHLGDRILKTIVEHEEYGAAPTFDIDTGNGPLTLNVSLAVLKGTADWVDDVTLFPVYKTFPIEDAKLFRQIAQRGVVDEEVQCPICDYYSFYEDHLSQHLRMGHSESVESPKLTECKKCDMTLPEDEFFRHHVRRHPHLVCEICGILFEQTNQMRRHCERHESRLENQCELCGKTYKDQYILRSHINLVHEKLSVCHECPHCNKNFIRKAHLKRHLMHTHTDLKPFACDVCDYRSNARGDLNKHLLVHSDPSFRCVQCDKRFTHRKSLVLHEKRHRGIREFKCGLCDFFGYTHNHIRRHIERVHASTDLPTISVSPGVPT